MRRRDCVSAIFQYGPGPHPFSCRAVSRLLPAMIRRHSGRPSPGQNARARTSAFESTSPAPRPRHSQSHRPPEESSTTRTPSASPQPGLQPQILLCSRVHPRCAFCGCHLSSAALLDLLLASVARARAVAQEFRVVTRLPDAATPSLPDANLRSQKALYRHNLNGQKKGSRGSFLFLSAQF